MKKKYHVLIIDSDPLAIQAIMSGLPSHIKVDSSPSVVDGCSILQVEPKITAVVLGINSRTDHQDQITALWKCADRLPIILHLGFPPGEFKYSPPQGMKPFGVVSKGENPQKLFDLLRQAINPIDYPAR